MQTSQNNNRHIIEDLADDDVEVEIDEDVKEIISSPSDYANALLDVTIIKPQEVGKLYTIHKKTLKGADVQKIIASMNVDKKAMKKMMNNLLAQNSKNEESESDEFNKNFKDFKSAGDFKKKGEKEVFEKKEVIGVKQQVYTTFGVMNGKKGENEESGVESEMGYVCHNCAVKDEKKKGFKIRNNDSNCRYYFQHISRKIADIEERLTIQENTSVPKEYFKKIITRLVMHLNKDAAQRENSATPTDGYISEPENVVTRKDNKKHQKLILDKTGYKSAASYSEKSYENFKRKYNINPLLVNEKHPAFETVKPPASPPPPIEKPSTSENFRKWSEEFLKPGIDIKNRVTILLEDVLKTLKGSKYGDDIKGFIEQVSNTLYKTAKDLPDNFDNFKKKHSSPRPVSAGREQEGKEEKRREVEQQEKRKRSEAELGKERRREGSGNYRSKKRYGSAGKEEGRMREESRIREESRMGDESRMGEESRMREEGRLRAESQMREEKRRNSEAEMLERFYKAEFFKIISKTNPEDKRKLWDSIWVQCQANGKSKQDKATIQLPQKKDAKCGEILEFEYTIGELENLLIGKRK